jgi:hypothetical protein
MDFEKAKLNPAAVFKSPQEVVSSQELSRKQKIEILRRWEQDATLMEVAEEEGMPARNPNCYSRSVTLCTPSIIGRIMKPRAPAKPEKRTARSRDPQATPFNLTPQRFPQCLIQAASVKSGLTQLRTFTSP